MLLWLLYVYEGFNHRKTYERQRAVRGAANALTMKEVRQRLGEMGVFNSHAGHSQVLTEMDPDDLGDARPEGDDSWQDLYSTG